MNQQAGCFKLSSSVVWLGLQGQLIWCDLLCLAWKGMHLPGGTSWRIEVVIMSLVHWNGQSFNQN